MKIYARVFDKERKVVDHILRLNIEGNKYAINYAKLRKQEVFLVGPRGTLPARWYSKVMIKGKAYYAFAVGKKLYLTTKLNRVYRRRSFLRTLITKKKTIFYGLYSDISGKQYIDCDNVFLNDKFVCKVNRPFKNIPKLKHLAIITIDNNDIFESGEIHSTVSIGNTIEYSLPLKLRKRKKGINYYSRKRIGDHYIVIRSTIASGSVRIVHIPMQPEYTKINMLKNYIACKLSKILKRIVKPKILMFEKETNRACESGYYIFEKLMKVKNKKADVYFVINKDCADFEKVYKKYPKNTLIKYSFKHYLYIYLSKYFISSELSNHVINTRLYIENLNRVISKKPLIFLQHGIMFSKPVDNPAAAGFNKKSKSVRYYKCIISSELEATQFYKCGFSRNDLIKCGLPKFDVSTSNPNADKIMIMLTYRYWEEGLIMNPRTIKTTTYYKTYMKLIKAFEKAGLIDKLLISCHPKFSDCIIKAAPEYEKIVETDVGRGLENSKIFITDYSSASYDAHYRGAYIIYYWAEKDYLIENYQAIPPINETNCDGVPVYSPKELIDEIQNAINKNYKMDRKYENRYKKINEYHDNKNYVRLIRELKKLDII